MNEKITIQTSVSAPLEKTWEYYTKPEHVTQWNQASEDWHCPNAENDLKVGGRFSYFMEAKDGSVGFEFSGTYDEVEFGRKIAYTMDDDRKVEVVFEEKEEGVFISVTFEAENENSKEMQRDGWQAILDNFKEYVEGN